jgi:membrane-bound serine protease (ClpP class)
LADDDPSTSCTAIMVTLGIALLVVGVVLMVAEAHPSTGGLIAAGASAAFIAGVVVLLVVAGASAAVVLGVAVCVTVAAGGLLVLGRRRILRPLRARPRTGREALVGRVGVVRSGANHQPEVFVEGSLWRAEPDPIHEHSELHDGERVVVDSVNGLTLRVRKAEEWELTR